MEYEMGDCFEGETTGARWVVDFLYLKSVGVKG